MDEEGTEASAATVVVISKIAILDNEITLNKPFLYLIREKHTETILFIGKLGDPS